MGKYFAKRLGMAILTIFLVACLTFLLMNAVCQLASLKCGKTAFFV